MRNKFWNRIILTLLIVCALPALRPADALAAEDNAYKLLVAPVGFVDSTGKNLLGADKGASILRAKLSNVRTVELVPEAKISKMLKGLEPEKDTALSVGRAVEADIIIYGTIADMRVYEKEQVTVNVDLWIFGAEDGVLLSRSAVTGDSGRNPGFSGDIGQLGTLALRNGVERAIDGAFTNLARYGIVNMVTSDQVFTNLSQREGVVPGSEIAVIRNYEQIALVTVEESGISQSNGKVKWIKPGDAIKPTDRARVVFNPAEPVNVDKGIFSKNKKGGSKLSPLALGVVALGIIAVASSQSGGKSEPPRSTPASTAIFSPNTTGSYAGVYVEGGFHPDYIPNPPIKISISDPSNALSKCYVANCNPNTGYCPAANDAYEFTLATVPVNRNFPTPYTIGIVSTSLTSAQLSSAKIATCDVQPGDTVGTWAIVSGSGYKSQAFGGRNAVTGQVQHFTPYVVMYTNTDTTPLPAPGNFRIQCGDQQLTFVWNQVVDSAVEGYTVRRCPSPGNCPNIYDTITTPSCAAGVCSKTYSSGFTNGVNYCFSMEAYSSGSRPAISTGLSCATPSTTCLFVIDLISPANNELISVLPEFNFVGTGDSDSYEISVRKGGTDPDAGVEIYHTSITGEGPAPTEVIPPATVPPPPVRVNYSIPYDGTVSLSKDKTYTWQITGIKNINPTNPVRSETRAFIMKTSVVTETGSNTQPICTAEDILKPPVLVNPANGAQIQVTEPIFQWMKSSCATKYLLTVYNSSNMVVCQQLLDDVDNTSYSGGGSCVDLINGMTYTWNVRAANDTGISLPSSWYFFTKMPDDGNTTPLAAPTWYTIAQDGKEAVTSPATQLVVLRWHPVNDPNQAGYVVYRCQTPVCSESDKLAIIFNSQLSAGSSNQYCPSSSFATATPGFCDVSPTDGQTYYYQVAAINSGQQAGMISVSQSITLPLQKPQLAGPGSPAGGDITAKEPTLIWKPVNGALNYVVTVRDCGSSQNPCSGSVIWQTSNTTTEIKYAGAALVDQKVYGWRVRAYAGSVQSEDSQEFFFTKKPSTTLPPIPEWCGANCLPDTDQPYTTENLNSSIKLYWKKITSPNNITSYNIYRGTSPVGPFTNIIDVGQFDCGSMTKVVCFEDTYLARGADYYYYLEAVDSGSQVSNKSSVLKVTLLFNGPVLVSPDANATVYDPTPEFVWLPENGASFYRLEVYSSSDDVNPIWNITIPGTDTSAVFADPTLPPPAEPLKNALDGLSSKEYKWRVCSSNAVDISRDKCSAIQKFKKALKRPEPLQPANNISTASPIFTWTATPGATSYLLRICEGAYLNCGVVTLPLPKVLLIKEEGGVTDDAIGISFVNCDTSQTNCGNTGKYTWDIRAIDEFGMMSSSSENAAGMTFTKYAFSPPLLITPQNNAIISPNTAAPFQTDLYGNSTYNYDIYFSWDGDATNYIFRVEDTGLDGETTPATQLATVYKQISVGGENYNNTIGASATIPFSPGTTFRWNVTPVGSPFIPDNARIFRTGLPYPNLLMPQDGKQVIYSSNCDGMSSVLCVHFEWQAVYGAAKYEIEIHDSEGHPYECAAAKAPGIATGTQMITPVTSTFCDMSTTSVPGNYITFQWRVRARDGAGAEIPAGSGRTGYIGPWSMYRSFTVLVPSPVLSSPPDSGACDPAVSPASINSGCTSAACQDVTFYWSPIPTSPNACYRIEVSDTRDFRNLIIAADSINQPGGFVTVNNFATYYKTPLAPGPNAGTYGTMVNGIQYFWRVGGAVAPDPLVPTDPCGSKGWIYSNVYSFVRRPGNPINVRSTTINYDSVTIDWDDPVQCGGATPSAGDMVPEYPPTGGGFLLYQETTMPTNTTPPTNRVAIVGSNVHSATFSTREQTDYFMCITSFDASGYIDHPGHYSQPSCVFVHTPAAPTTP